jgi:hypothetical protein
MSEVIFGIDLFQGVRSFSMFLAYGVGLMDFGCIAVLGHTSFSVSLCRVDESRGG